MSVILWNSGACATEGFECVEVYGDTVQACIHVIVRYVIVITRAQGMYGIYCTEARGREAARGLNAINAMHPECACYNYFISRGHYVAILP